MPAIDIFGLCRMKVFSDLIHDQLGVEVRMRGDKICADLSSKPPVIYLPNLEYADEDDVSVLRGFALHEAGHVKYTDPKALVGVKDYLTFNVTNAFEDQRIEIKLRRDFPGGKDMLQESQNAGYRVHLKSNEGKGTETLFGQLEFDSFLDRKKVRKYVANLGREMAANKLNLSNEEYKKWVYEDPEIKAKMDKDGLTQEELYQMGLELLVGMAKRIGHPEDEESILESVGVRMEGIRFLHLWLYVWRGGSEKEIHRQYAAHAYKPLHDELMANPPKNTTEALAIAREWIRRLGIKPILPCDYRPGDEAKNAVDESEQARNEANNAHSAQKRMEKEAERKAKEMIEQSIEEKMLQDAKTEQAEKEQEVKETKQDAEGTKEKEKNAEDNLRRVRDRLAKERRRQRDLDREAEKAEEEAKEAEERDGEKGEGKRQIEQSFKGDPNGKPQEEGQQQEGKGQPGGEANAEGEGEGKEGEGKPVNPARQHADEMAERARRLRERIEHDERLMGRREEELGMASEDKGRIESELAQKNVEMGEAQKNAVAAEAKAEENRKIIRQQVNESYKPMIDPLKADADAKEAQARHSEGKRDRILQVIHDMDRQNDQQIGEGVLEKVLDEVIEKVRNQSVAEELDVEILSDGMQRDDAEEGGRVESAPVTALSARKYVPFDRAYDKVTRVQDSPKAMDRYEECRKEYAEVIQATTERLRKLWSPEKNKIKVNAEQGRLDPRNAYKLGLALKGANVDVTRVWKTITTKKDPRVAVSLLVDCSGSMSGQQIELAMKAACCLSEVMRALHIPHEIIGHTTDERSAAKLDMDGVDADRFSRFCPFQGYVFKEFTENAAPSNIFSDFKMDCNLDGEAVMWALKRLERRKEKTKICIVMSDGMPHAPLSQIEELERHLFTVAKKAEALEKDGMFLYGLGIGEVRVKEFYKHHSILNEVKDLPVATLDIVEYILTKMVGSL